MLIFLFPATCRAPTNIKHGSYIGSNYAGDSVTFTCDDQYFLDGSSVITCVNGRWNGTSPICRGKVKLKKCVGYGCFGSC